MRSSAALLVAAILSLTTTTAAHAARPRLGVLVVFDQMPMWLLERSAPFLPGGFGGLDGATCSAWYPYAGTETAPGHATLATGASPAVHGIGTNTWFQQGKPQYVTDDPRFPLLNPTAEDPAGRLERGASPAMLMVPTLGDAMKVDSGGLAHVVTLSHKDRAAILTGGRSADLAIFYDRELGRFTTSTAYAETLPAWLAEQGAALPKASRETGTWEPLPVPHGLEGLVPDDDRDGEGAMKGMGKTFPHNLKDMADPAIQKSAYRASPQGIDDLFTLALLAVDNVGLGQDDVPDLLVVSVSTTDVIGHNYGGGSLEQLDTVRRADRSLRRFLTALRSKVQGDIVVAVSSDHGAPPLPQTMTKAGLPMPTLVYEDVTAAADVTLKRVAPRKDGSSRVQGFFPPQLFVDFDDLTPAATDAAITALQTDLMQLAGIAHIYDMRLGHPDEDAFHGFMRESAPPTRAAKVFIRQEPRVLVVERKYLGAGTDHGSPYTYDRRVPFLLQGPGVIRGNSAASVDTRDIAATMAFLLGVPPPDACQGHPVTAILR